MQHEDRRLLAHSLSLATSYPALHRTAEGVGVVARVPRLLAHRIELGESIDDRVVIIAAELEQVHVLVNRLDPVPPLVRRLRLPQEFGGIHLGW